MDFIPIHKIQGDGLLSPYAGQTVTTRGVVTGATRKGFFIQDPQKHEASGYHHENSLEGGVIYDP